jgi:hypothetical protein
LPRQGVNPGVPSARPHARRLLGSRGSSAWQAAKRFLEVHPENINANREPPADLASSTDRPLRVDARKQLASLGIPIDPDALVGVLVDDATITSLCFTFTHPGRGEDRERRAERGRSPS